MMLENQLYQKNLGMYAITTKVERVKWGVRIQEFEQEYTHEKIFAMSLVGNLKS